MARVREICKVWILVLWFAAALIPVLSHAQEAPQTPAPSPALTSPAPADAAPAAAPAPSPHACTRPRRLDPVRASTTLPMRANGASIGAIRRARKDTNSLSQTRAQVNGSPQFVAPLNGPPGAHIFHPAFLAHVSEAFAQSRKRALSP